jgi:SnoaL-like domain
MNRERFLAYIEAYNTDKGSLARFYAPEIVFENPALTLSGPALMEFFGSLRGTVEDKIEPISVVCDGASVAMFGKHTVHALKDAELPIGRFKAGEVKTIGLFAFYDTAGDQITRIRLSFWPEGRL